MRADQISYGPSENELATLQQKFLDYEELSDNNASDNGLSLSASVTFNKQISEVIPTLGSNSIFVVYQINTRYNTYVCDGAFRHINQACAL